MSEEDAIRSSLVQLGGEDRLCSILRLDTAYGASVALLTHHAIGYPQLCAVVLHKMRDTDLHSPAARSVVFRIMNNYVASQDVQFHGCVLLHEAYTEHGDARRPAWVHKPLRESKQQARVAALHALGAHKGVRDIELVAAALLGSLS